LVPGIINRWQWHAFFITKTNAISLNNVANRWLMTPKFFIQVPEVGTDGAAIQFQPPK
jgi:hypothetical protein